MALLGNSGDALHGVAHHCNDSLFVCQSQAIADTPLIEKGKTKFQMISSATRMTGFYEAWESDPDNINVHETLNNKVVRVLLFDARTPWDVLEYLRDLHNKLNQVIDGSCLPKGSDFLYLSLCHPLSQK